MLAILRRASFWPPSMVYISSHHCTLLRKYLSSPSGIRTHHVESRNLWSKHSTSKPPWLDYNTRKSICNLWSKHSTSMAWLQYKSIHISNLFLISKLFKFYLFWRPWVGFTNQTQSTSLFWSILYYACFEWLRLMSWLAVMIRTYCKIKKLKRLHTFTLLAKIKSKPG